MAEGGNAVAVAVGGAGVAVVVGSSVGRVTGVVVTLEPPSAEGTQPAIKIAKMRNMIVFFMEFSK